MPSESEFAKRVAAVAADSRIADQTTRAIDAAINMAAAMHVMHEQGGDITTIGARIWNALDIQTREYLREIVPNA